VRTGVLYDFANPPEWRRPLGEVMQHGMEQIVRAEGLGIDAVWVTEHHFVDGYPSSPIPLLGAIAASTSRVRIGTGILVTPLHHPVRLAEELATLDVLSGGRVELGAGLGWAVREYEAFGVPMEHRVSVMREILDILAMAWSDDDLVYRGSHFALGPLPVLPKPVQRPGPPILGGATSVEGARRVARWGLPLMWLDRRVAEAYLAAWQVSGHPPERAAIEGYVNMVVCDDPVALWPVVRPYFRYQQARSSADVRVGTSGTHVQIPEPTLEDMDEARRAGRILVVTPGEAVAEIARRAAGLPVRGIFCHNAICGMPADLSDRHVELLATEVAPALRTL
jgi:alkanesulfonate monooxygenase SsuD/methylene tetrahydromethanopterin reductase-like flavin-dependent oxidoreductase (luciferase family)